jgi:nucleotide-binding universal stress UspA family protein
LIFLTLNSILFGKVAAMKPEYKKILFCSDFSLDADNAFDTALDMAKRYGGRLSLLHVLPSTDNLAGVLDQPGARKDSPEDRETIEPVRQKLIDRYLHRLGGHPRYEFQVLRGVPIVEIVRCARLQEMDLIVLGAAGRSRSNKLHFGSTAEQVARRAHCTVMCIRNP